MKQDTVSTFLLDLIERCREHKVKIILDPTKVEFAPGSECSGLFSQDPLELTVAINRPVEMWLPVMVHESCHMDQHLENSKIWTDCYIKDHDSSNILDMWLSGVVDLNPVQLKDVLDRLLNMELDCERRSVEKIKKFKLPIDPTEYIQKANAYVYFYRAIARTRKWTSAERSPYRNNAVWPLMPKVLYADQSFYKEDDPLVDLIEKNCF